MAKSAAREVVSCAALALCAAACAEKDPQETSWLVDAADAEVSIDAAADVVDDNIDSASGRSGDATIDGSSCDCSWGPEDCSSSHPYVCVCPRYDLPTGCLTTTDTTPPAIWVLCCDAPIGP
jgi:hypothetical protein